MTDVAPRLSREVAKPFEWRERSGKMTSVPAMETRHLFHTLRMIWNNTMPEDAWVGAVKLYEFGAFYTRDYFIDAVRAIIFELSGRNDLLPCWEMQIEQMAAYFQKKIGRLERPKLALAKAKGEAA